MRAVGEIILTFNLHMSSLHLKLAEAVWLGKTGRILWTVNSKIIALCQKLESLLTNLPGHMEYIIPGGL